MLTHTRWESECVLRVERLVERRIYMEIALASSSCLHFWRQLNSRHAQTSKPAVTRETTQNLADRTTTNIHNGNVLHDLHLEG
jgi:uncharacterized protein YqfB (UPF0267 family)